MLLCTNHEFYLKEEDLHKGEEQLKLLVFQLLAYIDLCSD